MGFAVFQARGKGGWIESIVRFAGFQRKRVLVVEEFRFCAQLAYWLSNCFKVIRNMKMEESIGSNRKDLRICVISTCQWVGISESLSYLLPNCHVFGFDGGVVYNELVAGKRKRSPLWEGMVDYLLIDPKIWEKFSFIGFEECVSHRFKIFVPSIYFSRYHPDIVFLRKSDDRNFLGVMDAYHSRLVFRAYEKGYGCEDTIGLFSEAVFDKIGYLTPSIEEKRGLVESFRESGIDIRKYLKNWSRHGSFMHTVNHVTIQPLFDISKELVGVMEAVSLLDEYPDVVCPILDGPLYGQVWPVYPEIAQRYGFEGGYRFKQSNRFQTLSLREFIKASFESYDQFFWGNAGESLAIRHRSYADDVLAEIMI